MERTQVICLANSWKFGERCIAGIDLVSGKWVRPVCSLYPEDGRVPRQVRIVDGYREPFLLEILEIPLESTGPNFGFECENRAIAPGTWQVVQTATIAQIISFINVQRPILHNARQYVTVSELQNLPVHQRSTLDLVYTDTLTTECEPREQGGNKWKATLTTRHGQRLINRPITDPMFADLLDRDLVDHGPYLVTVSLSMPLEPEGWTGPPNPCWKLVAGVIALSLCDQILVEMHLAGWSIDQGRAWTIKHYGKRRRADLTDAEKHAFIHHLKGAEN